VRLKSLLGTNVHTLRHCAGISIICVFYPSREFASKSAVRDGVHCRGDIEGLCRASVHIARISPNLDKAVRRDLAFPLLPLLQLQAGTGY